MKPVQKFIKEQGGKARFGLIGPFMRKLKLKPSWNEVLEMSLPRGRDKGRMAVFFETFPRTFKVDGMMVKLFEPKKAAVSVMSRVAAPRPATRLTGKQKIGRTR